MKYQLLEDYVYVKVRVECLLNSHIRLIVKQNRYHVHSRRPNTPKIMDQMEEKGEKMNWKERTWFSEFVILRRARTMLDPIAPAEKKITQNTQKRLDRL